MKSAIGVLFFPLVSLALVPDLYPRNSFWELLHTELSNNPQAADISIALNLLGRGFNDRITTQAAEYVFRETSDPSDIVAVLRPAVESQPNTELAETMTPAILCLLPRADREHLAEEWSTQFVGTRMGMAATVYTIHHSRLENTCRLAAKIELILTHYSVETIRQEEHLSVICSSLEAVGEPISAKILKDAYSNRGELDQILADTIEIVHRITLDSDHPVDRLIRDIFVNEYKGSLGATMTNCVALKGLFDKWNSDSVAQSPGDVQHWIRNLVLGMAYRAQSSRTAFAEVEYAESLQINELLDSCVVLLDSAAAKVESDQFAQDAFEYGEALFDAEMYWGAEKFFRFTIGHTLSPTLTEEAGLKLAELYENQWQATNLALDVLNQAVEAGSTRALARIAKIKYEHGHYDDALFYLGEYVRSDVSEVESLRAELLIAHILGKQGRHDEKRAVLEQLRKRTDDNQIAESVAVELESLPELRE